jgi:hypothetical protein
MIDKHLRPLLEATDTKLAQHNGEFTDSREIPDNHTRLGATRMAFELLGAFKAEDPALPASTVEVIVSDMPRPDYSVEPIDVGPSIRPARKETPPQHTSTPIQEPTTRKDPRPKD